MSFDSFLVVYPWDLAEDGVEFVLDRLHGELGCTGIALWLAVPAVRQLRLRPKQPHVFHTRGGLFFQPSESRFSSTRCKPILSNSLKNRDLLTTTLEACHKCGLALRVIVSASCTGRLAERYSETACKNAFGDPSEVAVCLSNPDVQVYLEAIIAEASQSSAGVSVVDFQIQWVDAHRTPPQGYEWLGELERRMLGTCFCESCLQNALAGNVDSQIARRSVLQYLQNSVQTNNKITRRLETLLADNEPLAGYLRIQEDTLHKLWNKVVNSAKSPLSYHRGDDQMVPHKSPVSPGDSSTIVSPLPPGGDPSDLFIPSAGGNELELPLSYTLNTPAESWVSDLSKAAEIGFSGCLIHNYGLLPDAALTAIRQAVRFARRTVRR